MSSPLSGAGLIYFMDTFVSRLAAQGKFQKTSRIVTGDGGGNDELTMHNESQKRPVMTVALMKALMQHNWTDVSLLSKTLCAL